MKKKKTTPWEKIPTYPCPSQCLASKTVNGVHWQLFRSVKDVIVKGKILFWKTVTINEVPIYKLWKGDFSKEISGEEAMKILEIAK